MPFVAVGAGLLVLIRPQLLNFVVAACLILTGVVGLNGLYHFIPITGVAFRDLPVSHDQARHLRKAGADLFS